MSNAIELTTQNFESVAAGENVLVDFWASWCGPCTMLSPILDQVAEELAGDVTVAKVNVDDQPELAARFGVMSIPTLVLFRRGQEVARSVGVVPKAKLVELIQTP